MKKVKFAVVREDPLIEEMIIKQFNHKNILLIASGGCLALSLKSIFPKVNFTLFDLNVAQINLVKNKVKSLKKFDDSSYSLFNIGSDNCDGLNSCGEFESLFKSFRSFIFEFIIEKEKVEKLFLENENHEEIISEIIQNKYWPVAFDLYFSDSMLITMFGEDAVQHAKPNSYPRYFKHALETGLNRADFNTNYFLHHIFLGHYINDKSLWPYYLANPATDYNFQYINDNLLNIEVGQYDFISLSNVFDWMSEEQVTHHLNYLNKNVEKGTSILFRQLNNKKEYTSKMSGLVINQKLSKKALDLDKSLFYEKINILTKMEG